MLDNRLFKSLMDETIPFHDVMNTYDIRTFIAFNLPGNILGFVYVSRRGHYHLILNGNVTYETQCKTFIHEIKHITYDMPKIGYIIGLDMQYAEIENEADMVAEDMVNYLKNFR